MANPPPYDNITGISRAVMKDNAQETLANYNGNARPGELVVNLVVDPPALYVGNNAGQLTAVGSGGSGGLPLANGTSNFDIATASGNATISTAGTYTWTFDTTGNLTIPNGGYINFVNTGGITQAVNEDLRFTVSDDEQDGWAIQSTVNDGAGTDLTRMQVRYDGVRINTDLPTNNYNWDFRDTGEFDVPKSIRGPVGGNLVISIGDQFGSNTFIDLQTRSYVGDALISNIRIANPNVTVSTASGSYNWTFDGTGNVTIPKDILGLNNGSPIVIDAGGATGGYSYVSVPSFTDGGEQLVIKNNYGSSLGIRFQTETGNFTLSGTNFTFNDSTSQNTAYPGSSTALTLANVNATTSFGLPVYANATVRDSTISSPTPGMMIYVTGTGMQVRGATSWNTIAGSGT